jgi:hypothetical protein
MIEPLIQHRRTRSMIEFPIGGKAARRGAF